MDDAVLALDAVAAVRRLRDMLPTICELRDRAEGCENDAELHELEWRHFEEREPDPAEIEKWLTDEEWPRPCEYTLIPPEAHTEENLKLEHEDIRRRARIAARSFLFVHRWQTCQGEIASQIETVAPLCAAAGLSTDPLVALQREWSDEAVRAVESLLIQAEWKIKGTAIQATPPVVPMPQRDLKRASKSRKLKRKIRAPREKKNNTPTPPTPAGKWPVRPFDDRCGEFCEPDPTFTLAARQWFTDWNPERPNWRVIRENVLQSNGVTMEMLPRMTLAEIRDNLNGRRPLYLTAPYRTAVETYSLLPATPTHNVVMKVPVDTLGVEKPPLWGFGSDNVFYANGRAQKIQKLDLKVLRHLWEKEDRRESFETLAEKVWGNSGTSDSAITALQSRLNRALRDVGIRIHRTDGNLFLEMPGSLKKSA